MSNSINVLVPVNLHELIRVHPNGLRSIQVETDIKNQQLADSYVLTAQSRSCLSRILHRVNDHSYGRSWTLTGPYGSGKSFFSLFLMNLASPELPGNKHAVEQLSSVDPILSDQISRDLNLAQSSGLFAVAVTGFRASIQECLKQGFLRAIRHSGETAKFSSLVPALEMWSANTDSRSVVQWMQNFLAVVTSEPIKYSGVVLVFDEMGKPLEYAAAHPEEIDVFLLQEIAEFANRSGERPFIFIGILHQAFERYATVLDQTTKREWAKVQGRFEDISFQEPYAQQTRLLARAIESANPESVNALVPNHKIIAADSVAAGWCPTLMSHEEFLSICQTSYPFHPSSLVVLPPIFKRLAQNERSIFAFLASYEPFGFQEFLKSHTTPAFLRLPDLFDYLVANFQSRMYASNRARALTETLERLASTSGLSDLEIEIVKTIGLMSWLSEVSTIQPTDSLIISALLTDQHTSSAIRTSLDQLKKLSIIVFRRHNRTYAIWQGSDVDLDERMEQAERQVSGAFGLADAVQQYLPPRPLIARRHSYQTGTLRFFEVRYIDHTSYHDVDLNPRQGTGGLVLLCLAANQGEINALVHWAESERFATADGVLVGITKRTSHLSELLYDLRCYHWVEENTPELRDDKVAQKELFTRINSLETMVKSELDQSVGLHSLADNSGCIWKYKSKDLDVDTNEGISQILSKICDKRYQSSPIIRNELINRRLLSSQSAAARRNLIEAMITKAATEQLGIEGYPPERSIYESVLVRGRLHRQNKQNLWTITEPDELDPLKFQPAFRIMNEFVFTDPPQPRPITDLYRQLNDAPFGITEGVLSVLLCVFLLAHQDEVTLYREGTLLAEPGVPDWEVLLRRPDLYSIAGCRVTGTRAAIVERIARGLKTSPMVMPIVRELVRQLNSLPDYAWKTNQISPEAIELRRSFEMVRSPEQLLFVDIPNALGLQPITGNGLDNRAFEEFFNRLNRHLAELAAATPRRREWARDTFLQACELEAQAEGWETFIRVAREMNGHVIGSNLAQLIKRAAEAADSTAALESVLALIANRPIRVWTDFDVDRFPMLAQSMGRLFLAERNGYLPGLALTKEEKARSEQLAESIQVQLNHIEEDPRVLQAALQRLIELYRSDNSTHNS